MNGDVARAQLDADRVNVPAGRRRCASHRRWWSNYHGSGWDPTGSIWARGRTPKAIPRHGHARCHPVGRDASRVADEVIAHLTGLVGATVTVTLEIEAQIPSGASDHVVRTVTENSRTLNFTSHGFEKE